MSMPFKKIPDEILFNKSEKAVFAYLVRKLHSSEDTISTKKQKDLSVYGISKRDISTGTNELEGFIKIVKQYNAFTGYRKSDKITFETISEKDFYTEVKVTIIKDNSTSYKARTLFIKINKLSSNKEAYGFKSLRKMAKSLNVTLSSLNRYLDELVAHGYINIDWNTNKIVIEDESQWGTNNIIEKSVQILNTPVQTKIEKVEEMVNIIQAVEIELSNEDTALINNQIAEEIFWNDEDFYTDEELKNERGLLFKGLGLKPYLNVDFDEARIQNEIIDTNNFGKQGSTVTSFGDYKTKKKKAKRITDDLTYGDKGFTGRSFNYKKA